MLSSSTLLHTNVRQQVPTGLSGIYAARTRLGVVNQQKQFKIPTTEEARNFFDKDRPLGLLQEYVEFSYAMVELSCLSGAQ